MYSWISDPGRSLVNLKLNLLKGVFTFMGAKFEKKGKVLFDFDLFYHL